ncbi:MAG: glycosyltransferase family 2 protein [Pseudomonadota bacterium]|nr:glycosyltransferase family 2 protein [Pseudomonadota bacterium]
MLRSRVVAVIPVLNEAGAIGPTVAAIPRSVVDAVIVVDGGSTDTTAQEARAAEAEVIVRSGAGYGRACALGVSRAHELGAEIVLFLDGDGADPAEEAGRLIDPIVADEADFVLATRPRALRAKGSLGTHQVLAGLLIGRAVGLMTGQRYSDMSAFRAIRLDRLAALAMQEMTYGWNLEMQMRAAHAGLRVRELPLPYRPRVAGHSKVAGSLRGTLKAGRRIMETLLRVGVALRRPGQHGIGPA